MKGDSAALQVAARESSWEWTSQHKLGSLWPKTSPHTSRQQLAGGKPGLPRSDQCGKSGLNGADRPAARSLPKWPLLLSTTIT